MLKSLWLTIACVLWSSSAYGQAEPFHVFEYDAKGGYGDQDDDAVEDKLLSSGEITGDFTINTCDKHPKWGSGLRFIVSSEDNSRSAIFALNCNGPDDSLEFNWIRIRGKGKNFKVVGSKVFRLEEKVGTTLPVSLTIEKNKIRFALGNKFLIRKMKFDPARVELIGLGGSGIARFFELETTS
jgi:hypothetical protein